MIATKDLQRQHETITQDQQAWRQRRDDLVGQRDEQSARAAAGRTSGATALAELVPDERAIGRARKETAAAEQSVVELEAAIRIAEARIQDLQAAEQALTARRQATALSEMLARTEAKAEAFARAQEAANRELEVFLLAETECERFAAGLRRGPSTPSTPALSGATLGRVALWRLNQRLDDVSGPLGLIYPEHRRPLRDFWREAWRPLRESLETLIRGR